MERGTGDSATIQEPGQAIIEGETSIPFFYLWCMQYIAFRRDHVPCPMCDGHGMIIYPDWHHPRPCEVCRGVRQVNPMSLSLKKEEPQVFVIGI